MFRSSRLSFNQLAGSSSGGAVIEIPFTYSPSESLGSYYGGLWIGEELAVSYPGKGDEFGTGNYPCEDKQGVVRMLRRMNLQRDMGMVPLSNKNR
jgi:hypothetical protein